MISSLISSVGRIPSLPNINLILLNLVVWTVKILLIVMSKSDQLRQHNLQQKLLQNHLRGKETWVLKKTLL